MRVSEITTTDVADYLRLDADDPEHLTPILTAAIEYVVGYTGLTEQELDEHEDFYVAIMALCQDMYDNRTMYAEKEGVNPVVESILFRHRSNFV